MTPPPGAAPERLGELTLFAQIDPSLRRILALTGARLHPELERLPKAAGGRSRRACVLASLTLRDLLIATGQRAETVPCRLGITHVDPDGTPIRQLMIGDPEETDWADHWNGHMVVRTHGLIVDPTLGQARRDSWPDLPEMVALPERPHDPITRLIDAAGRTEASWTPLPDTSWHRLPDARPMRRRPTVKRLARLLQHT